MHKKIITILHLLAIYCLSGCMGLKHRPPADPPLTRPTGWHNIKHVVVIVLENGSPISAINQPYMNELTKKGAFLSSYYAITHPSQPNYIAMIAGSNFNIFSNENVDLDHSTIGDLLHSSNMTWKVYAEDYPGQCFLGARNGPYARKHVPFLSFTSVQTSPQLCNNVVDGSQFFADLAADSLPTYSMYVPNLNDDGHDTSVQYADGWLKGAFGRIFDDQAVTKDTLFIVTFDEDDRSHANRVYTVFIGAGVRKGARSSVRYDHYSLLRTIEEIFHLGTLGRHDAEANAVTDIWQ